METDFYATTNRFDGHASTCTYGSLMAYILIALALLIGWLDYLGTANVKAAATLLYQEVFQGQSGQQPFWKWLGALIIIGAIGYVPELEGLATAMLILVILVIVLSKASGFNTLIQDL